MFNKFSQTRTALTTLGLAGVVCFSLAACGEDDGTTTAETAATVPVDSATVSRTESATVVPAEPVTNARADTAPNTHAETATTNRAEATTTNRAETATVAPGQTVKADPADMRLWRVPFEKFTLQAKPSDGGSTFDVALFHNDREVYASPNKYVSFSPGNALNGFPLNTCKTRKVEGYTGGANCCFGYYILSACGSDDYAVSVAADGQSTVGEPQDLTPDGSVKGLSVGDPSFMYYQPGNQSGEDALFINGADSPRPSRFMVFEDGTWRMDRIGEFPALYDDLRLDAEHGSSDSAARAIELAYYATMAGAQRETVTDELAKNLPANWAQFQSDILSDIDKASKNFNPIKTIDVTN